MPEKLIPGHWQPGESGNPLGRPKLNTGILEYIRAKLKEFKPGDPGHRTWLEALGDATLAGAMTDVTARKDLLDRLLGKPVESLRISDNDGEPLKIEFVLTDTLGRPAANARPVSVLTVPETLSLPPGAGSPEPVAPLAQPEDSTLP